MTGTSPEERQELSGDNKTSSGRMIIDDEGAGLKIDIQVSGVPEETVARRLHAVLELVDYHRFQEKSGDGDE